MGPQVPSVHKVWPRGTPHCQNADSFAPGLPGDLEKIEPALSLGTGKDMPHPPLTPTFGSLNISSVKLPLPPTPWLFQLYLRGKNGTSHLGIPFLDV